MSKVDILLVGGGSGGHLTPLIPIAEALHLQNPNLKIAHVGQKNDSLNSIVRKSPEFSEFFEVSAGKFRRYFGESWLYRVFDLKTNALNVRDLFRILAGTYQSWRLLGEVEPKVILAKGGYVGVPVCVAARFRNIPYITHDSDAIVSLANKIISKNAIYHATAYPPEEYADYDQEKTIQVGIPVRSQFIKVTAEIKSEAKKELGYNHENEVLLILGGGLGAKKINMSLVSGAKQLLTTNKELRIIHISGNKLLQETDNAYKNEVDSKYLERVNIMAFSDNLHILSAAADVIVTRAGATNMAEFSAQGKACIIVPNPLLSGGHQTKNAKIFKDLNAAIIVTESNLKATLIKEIQDLLKSKDTQDALSASLNSLFIPGAATEISDLLIEVAGL